MDDFGGMRCVAGLAYRDTALSVTGAPQGAASSRPVLVLVHGGAGSRSHWVRNIEALSARFRVLSVDLPGLGESARPPPEISPFDYADWFGVSLRAMLDAVSAPSFHLAAFSFGAVVSCLALARGAPMPRAMTLIGPGGFGPPQARTVSLLQMPKRGEASEAEIRVVVASNLAAWMLAEAPSVDDPVVDLHLRNISRTRFDSRSISLGASLLDDLPRLAAPLQVIWGGRDRLADPSIESRMARVHELRPDARLVVVPEAGHWTQYDAAAAVNSALLAFHA